MKDYLLIAWSRYYPSGGTDDWVDTFNTFEEAEAEGHRLTSEESALVEYYKVVDLRSWAPWTDKLGETFHFVARAEDECPLCRCGTLEETDEEFVCRGECGEVWTSPPADD